MWGAQFLSNVSYCSLRSCWLWLCRVAGIFYVAGYDTGTFVVSLRRGFRVGGLPVDVWAVSNVEVCGCHIKGEICQVCVYTRVFNRPSSTHTYLTYFSFDMTTVDLNITYRPYVHRQPTHTEPPTQGNDKSPGVIPGHVKDSRHSTRP